MANKRRKGRRSTPPGEHRPVLLDEVIRILDPAQGTTAVDCTLGWGGHAVELLRRLGPTGHLVGIDLDADNLPRARERLQEVGQNFSLFHGNFAGLPSILAEAGFTRVDLVFADLGMSSMQIDDPERGFSYARDGALDMRMNRARGATAAQVLADIAMAELAEALAEFGDEPQAKRIASAIVAARARSPLLRTHDLVRVIEDATGVKNWRLQPRPGKWQIHPAARTFQALRIFVNRELANLAQFLRVLPECLRPGGRTVVISFHSGEDRLVKKAFREGVKSGVYEAAADEPIRPSFNERVGNPRSRSAKLRWARLKAQ
jgi:16S rRNA (cytosine1402-N4)-methyltransferase